MQQITAQDLTVGTPLDKNLFHRSGAMLFRAGQRLAPHHLQSLQASGVGTMYLADSRDELAPLTASGLEAIPIESLVIGQLLSHDLCDAKGTVLLSRRQILRSEHHESLVRRGIGQLYAPQQEALDELRRYEQETVRQAAEALDQSVQSNPAAMRVVSDRPPFIEKLVRRVNRNVQQREQLVELRQTSAQQAGELLTSLREGRATGQAVQQIVHDSLDALAGDSNLLVHMAGVCSADRILEEDPRADHLVNVCMLSLSIGAYLNYDRKALHELGICAFLHDIGMAMVQQDILIRPQTLGQIERLEVEKHPIHAVNLLERMRDIPPACAVAVYQTHERLGGQGYPKKRRPPFIHDYARIIAVADTYTAMHSPRPHRKAMLPYQAMESVVRQASGGIFDVRIVRALLESVGLYPVGSWVELNNREVAKVVGAPGAGGALDRPVVAAYYDMGGNRVEEPLVLDLAREPMLKVVKALPAEQFEQDLLLGF